MPLKLNMLPDPQIESPPLPDQAAVRPGLLPDQAAAKSGRGSSEEPSLAAAGGAEDDRLRSAGERGCAAERAQRELHLRHDVVLDQRALVLLAEGAALVLLKVAVHDVGLLGALNIHNTSSSTYMTVISPK